MCEKLGDLGFFLKEELEHQEFERLSLKLGIPVPRVFIKLESEKGGRILERYQDRSRTWNRNFWNMVLCFIAYQPGVATNFGAGYLSFKDTTAAVASVGSNLINIKVQGAVNDGTYGIQVGRGVGAESFEGYALGTPVVNGTGTNQLVYSAMGAGSQNYNAGTRVWTITLSRVMNNNSSGIIGLNEVALTYQFHTGSTYLMLNRDLLGSTFNVAIGAQLTVTYNITLTFPA